MTSTSEEFDESRALELHRNNGRDVAAKYLQRFIDQHEIRAMIGMADMEYDENNFEVSLAWMSRAEQSVAEDDFVSPIYLSSAYHRGLGAGTCEERQQKALQMRERVAESGNVVMQHALMSEYLYGLNGVPVSKEKFTYWASRAANLGSAEAAKAIKKLPNWPNIGPGE
jgi:TPR repeat protein